MDTTAPLGIDVDSVARWFADHLDGAVPPLRYERITGGHSNLTYVVVDSNDTRYVLRRPPVGQLLATAHNVIREHDIMAALAGTGVPLPQMLGACQEETVTGAPFYVMAYVDGVVLNTFADVDPLLPSPDARRRAGELLIDALATLHAVDIEAVGLGTLARRDGFLERQLKRWSAQWESTRLEGIDGMDALHAWLVAHQPPEQPARVVHGDFRLGNSLLASDGTVLAIVDWELCTLGEPLADVAYFLRSWTAMDRRPGQERPPSSAPGFLTGDELTARYAAASGRSLHDLDYWRVFTAWRSAAILAGVYCRYRDGKMGTPPDELETFRDEVEARVQQGLEIVGSSQ